MPVEGLHLYSLSKSPVGSSNPCCHCLCGSDLSRTKKSPLGQGQLENYSDITKNPWYTLSCVKGNPFQEKMPTLSNKVNFKLFQGSIQIFTDKSQQTFYRIFNSVHQVKAVNIHCLTGVHEIVYTANSRRPR